jgi:hypothetical protein
MIADTSGNGYVRLMDLDLRRGTRRTMRFLAYFDESFGFRRDNTSRVTFEYVSRAGPGQFFGGQMYQWLGGTRTPRPAAAIFTSSSNASGQPIWPCV